MSLATGDYGKPQAILLCKASCSTNKFFLQFDVQRWHSYTDDQRLVKTSKKVVQFIWHMVFPSGDVKKCLPYGMWHIQLWELSHPWQETLRRAKAHINTHNCANWLRHRLHRVQTAKKVVQLFYLLLIFCAVNYAVRLHNECVPLWSSGDWLLMGTHLLCNLTA